MKNGYIYSVNVDVYYPDIKFVYDTTKIEMSQYYFDCNIKKNNNKYKIKFFIKKSMKLSGNKRKP